MASGDSRMYHQWWVEMWSFTKCIIVPAEMGFAAVAVPLIIDGEYFSIRNAE